MKISPLKINIIKNNLSSKNYLNNSILYPLLKETKTTFLGNKKEGNIDFKTNFENATEFDKKTKNPIFEKIDKDFAAKIEERINADKSVVIGITGESAAGKSTLADELIAYLQNAGVEVSLVKGDNYFNDVSELIKKYGSFENLTKNGYDTDAPSNFRLDLLKEHINALKNGKNIKTPKYILNGTGKSVLNAIPIQAKKVIIVEGIAAGYPPAKDALDACIYVDIDHSKRYKRFINRAKERSQDEKGAIELFNHTEDSAKKYIRPLKEKSDIVINGGCNIEDYRNILSKILNNEKIQIYPKEFYLNQMTLKPTFQESFKELLKKDKENKIPFVENINFDFLQKIKEKLKSNPDKNIIIGITGKSASGKSTLTEKFIQELESKGVDVTLLNGDQYFKDTSHLVEEAGSMPNLIASGYEFDAPSNFRLNLLKEHLEKLSNGINIKTPKFIGDGTGSCPAGKIPKKPSKIIIVEGLPAHYPLVRDVLDAKIFINVKSSERLKRFVERAPFRHPDWEDEDIIRQYISTTNAADKYIEPAKYDADIVLNSGADKEYIEKFLSNLAENIKFAFSD